MDLKSDVLTLQNQCPKVNPSVSKISLPLHSAIQDTFPHWKSSLQELFSISGCIPPLEIIPARAFLQIRMNLPTGNHPYKTFPAYQDAFPRRKSSLQELFCISGSIFPAGIIPARTFLQFRMHFPAGNHPCYEVTIVKKRLKEISFSRQATFVFL